MKIINRKNIFLLLFIISIIIRSLYFIISGGISSQLSGDEPEYHSWAVAFLSGNGPLGIQRPPLTSILLIPFYYIFGSKIIVAKCLMIIISSLVAPLLFILYNSFFQNNQRFAVLLSLAWCFYPPSIFYSSLLLTENIAPLLLIISLYFIIKSFNSTNISFAFIGGVFFGLCALNRSSFLLLLVFLFMLHLVIKKMRNSYVFSLKKWAFVFLGILLTLMPWTLRNYFQYSVFAPVEYRLGYGLYLCNGNLNHKDIKNGYYVKDTILSHFYAQINNEIDRDNQLKGLALLEIKKNPNLLYIPIINRAKNFWTFRPNPYKINYTQNDWVMLIIWIVIFCGFIISFKYWSIKFDWPMLLCILYAFLTTLPFWGTPRFRFPVDPFIIARAIIGLSFFLTPLLKKSLICLDNSRQSS